MPGTTMIRVFHWLPSERMIQIRPTWQSTAITNIGQPSRG